MVNIMQRVSNQHQLHIDQMGTLAEEIDSVLLGLEPSANFVKNIQESLQIDQATAESVAANVNNEIFLKIRESLKQMEENKNTPKQEELLHPDIFAKKLSESVNLKPIENTLTINPDRAMEPSAPTTKLVEPTTKNTDPYLEPI